MRHLLITCATLGTLTLGLAATTSPAAAITGLKTAVPVAASVKAEPVFFFCGFFRDCHHRRHYRRDWR